ncbi:hypothetical protein AYI68_g5652 [Smittium mucronatum]|uniref:Uncharacterized protein n=1 Tax=Smittium mucronatum TaxID=133383 RepID=A0A1R0GTN1_9FUNG|nr:hypothetical protein AYI68_g5652 [Smittium mucronatum]
MGMVMRNHELVESGAYPYWFAPEVEAWHEVTEDREGDISVQSSSEVFALGEDLDPSVNLAGEAVMEDLVSSLMGLSLSADPNSPVRLSPIIPTVGAVQKLSVVSTGSKRRSVDGWSKGVILAQRSLLGEGDRYTSNNVLSVASPSATQQQFRSEDLYQSNFYRESASENIQSSFGNF